MKILIDTNIIIDALTGREPFREAAEQIFLLAANQTADMYITASSATDIYYIVRKHLHIKWLSRSVADRYERLWGFGYFMLYKEETDELYYYKKYKRLWEIKGSGGSSGWIVRDDFQRWMS